MPELISDERWAEFGDAFIKCDGNIQKACEEIGMVPETVHMMKKRTRDKFKKIVTEAYERAFEDAERSADADLTKAVSKLRPPLTSDERALLKLFYERTGKIQTRIENFTTINPYLSIGDAEIVNEIADWKAAQIANARKN